MISRLEKEWTTKVGLKARCIINLSRCGYVEVPKAHKWFGVNYHNRENYKDSPESIIDVHGGLTYSGDLRDSGTWWFGFDCNHLGDRAINSYTSLDNMGHLWTLEEVIEQCESMAEQLIKV